MAAEELFRVRTDFVEGVSDEMINQLLDDLLQDKVLNKGERLSIRGVSHITPEKARLLIDTVIAKKDTASLKMIARIKSRDSCLYDSLHINPSFDEGAPQAALTAAAPQTKWSVELTHCSRKFWKEKQLDEDEDVYPAFEHSLRRRVALLITNIEFADPKLNRSGAATDEKNMDALLSALRYEVVKHRNCTAEMMDKAVRDFSQHEKLRDTDSVIVVIMSHGILGNILGVNYKKPSPNETPDLFPIDNICKHLNTLSCPALENKPKIVIIQACRGGESGSFLICDGANQVVNDAPQPGPSTVADDTLEHDGLRTVPREQDFGFLFSSTPHCKSYRDPVLGSILIQGVVNVFNTFAHQDHMEELLRRVTTYCINQMKGSQLQVPTRERCSLSKRFYLFPGI